MTQLTAKPFTARPLTARPFTAYPFGESTSVSNPLVWHAAYPDSDGVMQAQLIGSGAPSFTVDDGLLLPDYQGVYVAISEDTPPWHGARWVDGVAYGTDGSGDPLDPLPSLYGAPSYTNSLTYSNDLTQWTQQIGTSVSALDAVGLTGAPNTATTLTDDNGAGNEYVIKLVTIPNDSNTNTFRFFVLKDSDETRFPEFQCILDGGTSRFAYVQLNTKTGAKTFRTDIGTNSAEVNDRGVFWELLISMVNNSTGNALGTAKVHPSITTSFGSTESAATGSIIVGNCELHLNKSIADVRGIAPIITSASAASTSAIAGVYDSDNWDDASGGLYCEVTLQVAQNILSTFLDVSGSTFRLNDGTNTATSAWVTNGAYQVGIAWDASAGTMAINADGEWSSNVTYDGTLLAGALDIFRSPAGAGLIRNIKRYSASSLAAAKALIDVDTMPVKDLVLLIGQSNMGGRADYDDNGGHAENTMQWDQSGELVAATIPLDHPYQPAGSMGLDISFSTEYASSDLGNQLIFIPCAEGTTGFSDSNWNQGDAQYEDAVSRVNAALSTIPGSRLLGILWLQGENDAQDSRTEAQYGADLDAMIAALRSDISGATNAPFVACQIPNLSPGSFPTEDDVNAAILDLPNRVSNTAVVANTGLTTLGDGVHYGDSSLRSIGVSMFNALSTLL